MVKIVEKNYVMESLENELKRLREHKEGLLKEAELKKKIEEERKLIRDMQPKSFLKKMFTKEEFP